MPDVGRREELSLLEIDHAPGARSRFEQVGLTRQKRRNLKHVGDFGDRRRMRGLVDVGENGDAGSLADAREDHRPLRTPWAAEGSPEVRLALSCEALKTNGVPASRDITERDGDVDRVGFAFDDTRTRDEQQRTAAHREPGKLNRLHAPLTYHGRRRLHLRRARMPVAGFDESGERRMWLERFRFELGVELHRR